MRKKPNTNNKGPVVITGAKVFVKNDDVNGALRRLKKILEGADRQKELSKREFYEKPSSIKKRSRISAKKRATKEQRQRDSMGQVHKPVGLKYMKSKRKRRKILDAETALTNLKRKR